MMWQSDAHLRSIKKCMRYTYLSTWLVHTITDCWVVSVPSLICRTTCSHNHCPELSCSLNRIMQDLSCSDCVTKSRKTKIIIIFFFTVNEITSLNEVKIFEFYFIYIATVEELLTKTQTTQKNVFSFEVDQQPANLKWYLPGSTM